MSKKKIAINGFGRIGRAAFKIAVSKYSKEIEVVGINDLSPNNTLAHLLKHDTVYGNFDKEVSFDGAGLIVDGKHYPVFNEKDPLNLPWKKLSVDIAIECTGIFTKREDANKHIEAGAKKVILSAPGKSEDISTCVLGVSNHDNVCGDIISNASCTTNCIAPVVSVVNDKFGVSKAMMTTVHSYTADQNLVDGSHKKDLRRARAAACNIIPTSTGAAIATTKTIPSLKGLFDGLAIRVPTPVVSLSDITLLLNKKTTVQEINGALISASEKKPLKGILGTTNDPLVSSDFIGNELSSIVDLSLTRVVDGDLVKIIAWYDNEWGYSNRLVEMILAS